MPIEDADRWNARYRQERYARFEQPRPFLVENVALLPRRGLALDVAMGMGGNAGFLLSRGLRVIGVDIAAVAVKQAKQRYPALMAVLANLERFSLPSRAFDVLINFYYLQRDLWPAYLNALRPGGILVFETLTLDMLDVNPEIEPQYLLAPGELRRAFEKLEILVYREGWVETSNGHPRAVASLVARALSTRETPDEKTCESGSDPARDHSNDENQQGIPGDP